MIQANRSTGLRDHVYEHVKQLLFTGAYRPGMQIEVEKIASDLSVSRQPVMDALKRLNFDGFVTIIPQVGCHVRAYRPEEISDFFRIVAEVEPLAIELAAKRATPDDIVRMQIISGQIGAMAKSQREAREKAELYRTLNRQLHSEFGKAAKSGPVVELVTGFGDRCDFFIASANRPIFFERLVTAHEEHELIIKAIESGDGKTGANIMRRHIMAIEKRLREPSLESAE
jgi:DNA-binding GntR family transcriptional regulator